MQTTVLFISLFFMSVVSYFFISAVRASNSDAVVSAPERKRKTLITGMFLVGIVVTFASLWEWPHALSGSANTTTVNATGAQWYWDIDTEELPLGQPVVFNVHTEDVSHGLGVVNAKGRLLVQTQAMPGYVNKFEYTFTEPGQYRVICMEFCGVGHHDMITEFEVIAKTEAN